MTALEVRTFVEVMVFLWIGLPGAAQTTMNMSPPDSGTIPGELLERPLPLRQGTGQARSFALPSIELSQEINESMWPMFLLASGRTEEALTASRALSNRHRLMVQALGHVWTSRALIALNRMPEAASESDGALD
jgi:hypothetical protein